MNSNGNNSCKLGGDLLAYLYNEMPEGGRELFETHLADCSACTDEFAELSLARYSVYEWQKLEFAPMETPEIVIPYKAEAAGLSWFDKVRATFAFSNKWATAGPALAVLTLFAIGGLVVVSRYSDREVAGVQNVTTPSPERSVPAPVKIARPQTAEDEPVSVPEPARKPIEVGSTGKPQTVPVPVKNPPKGSVKTQPANVNSRNRNVPRLNGLDDEVEDKSLRLTDIFDDLDTLE